MGDSSTLPVRVRIRGFNPLIPGDIDASSIPMAVLSYGVTNTSNGPLTVVVSGNIRNIIGRDGSKTTPDRKGDYEPVGAKHNRITFRQEAHHGPHRLVFGVLHPRLELRADNGVSVWGFGPLHAQRGVCLRHRITKTKAADGLRVSLSVLSGQLPCQTIRVTGYAPGSVSGSAALAPGTVRTLVLKSLR